MNDDAFSSFREERLEQRRKRPAILIGVGIGVVVAVAIGGVAVGNGKRRTADYSRRYDARRHAAEVRGRAGCAEPRQNGVRTLAPKLRRIAR